MFNSFPTPPWFAGYIVKEIMGGTLDFRLLPPMDEEYMKATMEERVAYSAEMGDEAPTFYRGTGCKLCANTGYRGRTGLFELLGMNEEIRRSMLTDVSADDIKAEAIRQGMVTMQRDGMIKVKEGITSASEVVRSVLSIS